MNWFLLGLIPPAIWSLTNHFDKYLVSKFFKGSGVGALMIFSSLIGLIILPIVAVIHPEALRTAPSTAILLALNGSLYVLATLPYFYALSKDETSVAVPLFQLIPMFSYVLARIVLGETLLPEQIFGGILIVLGAIGISLELKKGKRIRFKKEVFWLMMLSSFIFAVNFLFFKFFAVRENFWTASFWEYVGFAAVALLLFAFVKPYRTEFIGVIRKNSGLVLGLNGINEILNIIGKVTFNFASLLAPITLTWIVNGFQPLFVFAYGILITLFLPKIAQEDISKRQLIQKGVAILVMFAGTYILNS
jgi:uncharacterized membrane protein